MKKTSNPPGRPRKSESEKRSILFRLPLNAGEVKRHTSLAKRLNVTRAAVLRDYINSPNGDRLIAIRELEELTTANETLKKSDVEPFIREITCFAIKAACDAIVKRYEG